jgi:MFS family permease
VSGVVCSGVVFSAVIGGFVFYALGSYFAPLQGEFHWSFTTVSGAFALQALATGVGNVIGGRLLDRVPPRTFAICGVLVVAVSFFALAFISSPLGLAIVFVVMGLAASPTAYMLFNALLAAWFPSRMGRSLALIQTGYGLGGLGVPLFVYVILLFGWRAASIAGGCVIIGLCIPASFLLGEPSRLPMSDTSVWTPKAPGQQGIGLPAALRSRPFWALLAILMISLGAAQLVYTHQIRAMISFGVSSSIAGLAVGLMAVCGLVGRLCIGRPADRFGTGPLLTLALILQGIGIGILACVRPEAQWTILAFALVFGVGQAAIFLLAPMVQSEFLGREQFSTLQGLLLAPTALTSAAAPLLVGIYVDKFADYRVPILIGAATVLAAALLSAKSFWARPAELVTQSS